MTNVTTAAGAYANTLKQLQGNDAQPASTGPSFGDILKESVTNAIDAQHQSEQVSAKALVGKADMTEVLQSVNDAEVALNTVLAIRDRVVQAYDTIMRTQM